MRSTRTGLAPTVAAVLVVVTAGAATAGWLLTGDHEVSDRGSCGEVGHELSVEREDGGREVSYELRSAAPGETWSLVVEQGGTPLLTADRTTDADGEIDVDLLADPDADPHVSVAASRGRRLCSVSTRW